MAHLQGAPSVHFTSQSFVTLILFELASLGLASYILVCRGWRPSALDLEVSWRLTSAGVFLFVLYYAGYPYVFYIVGDFTTTTQSLLDSAPRFSTNAPLFLIVAGSAVNALFEEAVVVGYVLRSLEQEGATFAITVSVLLRFAYHTYQGPVAIVSIIPFAVLFAFVYWHWRKLWPLVFAHFITDVIGFSGS